MSDLFQTHKQQLLKNTARALKHASRRLEACRQELNLCRCWGDLYHEGELLQSNLYRVKKGMVEISVSDWLVEGCERTIRLNPKILPHEQIQALFRNSKKRKRAIPHLEKQVQLREHSCKELREALEALSLIESEEALSIWKDIHQPPEKNAKKKDGDQSSLPYRTYYSGAGLSIRVGKGAKSNDLLTFRYSKGLDWWFHARDYPGSHVVLSVNKGQEPDRESIKDALLLALVHSKARDEKEAEIVVAQCKHVHKAGGGVPGKVQLGKHSVLIAAQDINRLKRLRS